MQELEQKQLSRGRRPTSLEPSSASVVNVLSRRHWLNKHQLWPRWQPLHRDGRPIPLTSAMFFPRRSSISNNISRLNISNSSWDRLQVTGLTMYLEQQRLTGTLGILKTASHRTCLVPRTRSTCRSTWSRNLSLFFPFFFFSICTRPLFLFWRFCVSLIHPFSWVAMPLICLSLWLFPPGKEWDPSFEENSHKHYGSVFLVFHLSRHVDMKPISPSVWI